jgi:hypothetical protein
MIGAKQMKATIAVTDTTVECPVEECSTIVKRQRKQFRRTQDFLCPAHEICISPTTFVYGNETDNLLWTDPEDLDLLRRLNVVKRESRMEHDNSEDAVTWNVFRYLEKTEQLSDFLSSMIKRRVGNAELIYWSYGQEVDGVWPELKKARKEFGEHSGRGTEPDLIIVTDNALFWVEAKLTASNDTCPSNPQDRKKYESGGDKWYEQVFSSEFEVLAIREKKYELMSMWLTGSWAAVPLNRRFYLVNLVRAESEKDIEPRFGPHLKMDAEKRFLRWTWEDVYYFVSKNAPPSPEKQKFMTYFENKTIGYKQVRGSESWELQLAFHLT